VFILLNKKQTTKCRLFFITARSVIAFSINKLPENVKGPNAHPSGGFFGDAYLGGPIAPEKYQSEKSGLVSGRCLPPATGGCSSSGNRRTPGVSQHTPCASQLAMSPVS